MTKRSSAIKRFGEEKARKIVIQALEYLSEQFPGDYFEIRTISNTAVSLLKGENRNDVDGENPNQVFREGHIREMLREGGALEEVAERVQVLSYRHPLVWENWIKGEATDFDKKSSRYVQKKEVYRLKLRGQVKEG